VGGTGIRIVNRALSCEHDSISRSIVVDWDAKRFSRSLAGEKIELRADLSSWPQWEKRLFGQVKRLKRMLAGVNGVLLAISMEEVAGMEEFLEHLASAVDESGLILWAVVTAPPAWANVAEEALHDINFPIHTGGGIVILPGQGRDYPEGRDVKLFHPSRRTEKIVVETLFMLSDGLFESLSLPPAFVQRG